MLGGWATALSTSLILVIPEWDIGGHAGSVVELFELKQGSFGT